MLITAQNSLLFTLPSGFSSWIRHPKILTLGINDASDFVPNILTIGDDGMLTIE